MFETIKNSVQSIFIKVHCSRQWRIEDYLDSAAVKYVYILDNQRISATASRIDYQIGAVSLDSRVLDICKRANSVLELNEGLKIKFIEPGD